MVRVAVAGYEVTEVGLIPQLPEPYVAGQLRVTAPAKPSCEVIEIGPLTPLLPTFTSGNAEGSLITKSGFAVTFSANELLKAEEAPAVVAWIVTLYALGSVAEGTATLAVILTGLVELGFTLVPGVSVQVAPGMFGVQDTVTL